MITYGCIQFTLNINMILRYRLVLNVVLVVLLCRTFSAAQDTTESILQTPMSDTLRIEMLNNLSTELFGSDPDKGLEYAINATELARSINDVERYAFALKNVGLGYYYKADFVSVLEYWEASLEAFESIDHKQGVANLLSNIGAVYYSSGSNNKALDYYLRALKISDESGDDFRKATVLQNIGAVYETTEEYEESKEYLTQALNMCEELGYSKGIATAALNLGEIYMHDEQYLEASGYFERARENFAAIEDNSLPTAIIMIGKLNAKLNNNAKALSELEEAYEMAAEGEGKVAMAQALNEKGDILLSMDRTSEAISTLQEALGLGLQIGKTEDLSHTYATLSEAYRDLADFSHALQYQDSLIATNKHIFDSEKSQQLADLQLQVNIQRKESEIAILNADNEIKSEQIARANLFRNFLIATALFLLIVVGGIAYQYRFAKKTNRIITEERNKSDQLLLNILPEDTADELKQNGFVKAKKYEFATVLFTDFVAFTRKAEKIPPEDLVKSVDYYFKNFDTIVAKHNLEKIKTIGDADMCAGGVPQKNENNTLDALKAAMEILEFVQETMKNPPPNITPFNIRVGINCGPVVAGVVGNTKFQFDIWGDTVNVASRMEVNCEPNKINVSENVYNQLKDDWPFEFRGEIDVKNRGKMKMYYLESFSAN